MIKLATTHGDILIELDHDQAPKTCTNFEQYVRDGHYDGTLFHRVIDGFMIQGGGLNEDMIPKPTRPPVENEAANGLKNREGTLAMARTNAPHSATSQFFINVQNNMNLDYRGEFNWGYAVFGRVVQGMEVVDDIRFVQTSSKPPFSDVPVEPVIIESVTIAED